MSKTSYNNLQAFETYFLEEGLLSAEALARAKASEQETGQALSTVLVNLGLISADKLADGLAAHLKIIRVAPGDFPKKAVSIPGLSPSFLKLHKVIPITVNGKTIRLAMANPADGYAREALEFAFDKDIQPLVASLADIEEAIQRLYFSEAASPGRGRTNGVAPHGVQASDFERLKDLAGDAPVIKFVEKTIGEAMDLKASDIHLEAMEERFRLRFRKDGILIDRPPPPKAWQAAIISRLKILSGLNIAERRLPQDGRFKITVRGREVDFRVSTIPSAHGESIVLRLLDRGKLPGDFASLGFGEKTIAPLVRALQKPDGIVLVTGPTGSGKTTTLYSALKRLNSPDKKILTVEDPIEYMLDGVNQVQVDPKIGRTFASTLRSFLRQDPDILLVGEIRDTETAEIAIQASLTGHLVLSTLHTNNAAGALTRLLDMKVEDYLITSTISTVVGQRLVRKLCADCRAPHEPGRKTLESFGLKGKRRTFYKPVGCPACSGTGYSGRTGIIEVLEMSDKIRTLVQRRAETAVIEKTACAEGLVPMFRYGLARAAEGVTTLEEILRVTKEV